MAVEYRHNVVINDANIAELTELTYFVSLAVEFPLRKQYKKKKKSYLIKTISEQDGKSSVDYETTSLQDDKIKKYISKNNIQLKKAKVNLNIQENKLITTTY